MEKLILNTSSGNFLIDISTIVRVEASSNYCVIFLSNGKKLVTAKLLSWFEKKLKEESFTRLHRSHLINDGFLDASRPITGHIMLRDGISVPVSRRRKKMVLQKLAVACLFFFFLTMPGFSQNVGIGTTSPIGKLHIDLTGSANTFAIIIDDDDTDDPVIRFRKAGTSKGFMEVAGNDLRLGTYATNPTGKLIFRTSSSERMVINPAGNIGIGIADPVSKLQINGGTDASLLSNGYLMLGTAAGQNLVFDNNEIMSRNDGAFADLFLQAEGGATQFGKTSESNIEIENTTIRAYYNGGSEELILQPNGKTRIGGILDFANTKFHISEGVDAGPASVQSGYMMIGLSNSENVVFDNNEILARNNGVVSTLFLARDGSKVQLGNGAEASGTKLHITSGNDVGLPDNLSGYLMMGSQTGTNLVLDNNEIQARNNGAAAHLYLQNTGGNVFIGDAANFTSGHRLGVDGNAVVTGALRIGSTVTPSGYKLAVDGKAICTELMVRTVPNWPDYVFNKNYTLTPLNELEKFILKNKHLPGIPTAKKLEQTGLNIGEMEKLQMEKIEELTLYIIELKKEIEKLKAKN